MLVNRFDYRSFRGRYTGGDSLWSSQTSPVLMRLLKFSIISAISGAYVTIVVFVVSDIHVHMPLMDSSSNGRLL